MALLDLLAGLNASFRGFPFHAEDESGEGGRRGPLHEYPDRDLPYFEDMGRAADQFGISAYFVGDTADLQARLFEAVLRKAGPGLLIHPTRGRQTVICRHWRRRTARGKANWVEFGLTFVEAGRNLFPGVGTSWPHALLEAADQARTAFADALGEALSLVGADGLGLTQEAVEDLIGHAAALGDVLVVVAQMSAGDAPSSALSLAASLAGAYIGELGPGLDTVLLAASTVALVGNWAAALAGPNPDNAARIRATQALFSVYDEGASDSWYAPAAMTPTELQEISNAGAFSAGIRRATLAEIVRQTASRKFASYDEAVALRDRLADAFDDEISLAGDPLNPGTASDSARQALSVLRGTALDAISAAGADKARLVSYKVSRPLPALVAAQLFYPDDPDLAGRAKELVERNGATNPAFLPVTGERLSS